MNEKSGIEWSGDLTAGLNQFGPKMKRAMVAAANYTAPKIQNYMRENAKWKDRTGAARNGLRTQVEVTTNQVDIVLFHTVPYGVFLEVRWGGRYAIILPAMQYGGPLFAAAIAKLAFDKGAA